MTYTETTGTGTTATEQTDTMVAIGETIPDMVARAIAGELSERTVTTLAALGFAVRGGACPECGAGYENEDGSLNVFSDGGIDVWRCCWSVCRGYRGMYYRNYAHPVTDDAMREQECPNCPRCEDHCECASCAWCGDKVNADDFCASCDRCNNHCVCVSCEDCGDKLTDDETYSHDGWSYCESCFDNRYFYCDECEEYVSRDDDHSHGCDCEVPLPRFMFGIDRVANDVRVDVQLAAGVIDDHGMRLITERIMADIHDHTRWSLEDIVAEVGPEWQTKRGNFTRRISSAIYKTLAVKLSAETVSEIGNLARQYSSKESAVTVEVTRLLNETAEYFYHEDSCWWGSYGGSRCCLKSWGGFGLRSFDHYGGVSGRAWVQPLNDALEATHDAASARTFAVYNTYGDLGGYRAARIVAAMIGGTYRRIRFIAVGQYVNNSVGYLVSVDADVIAENDTVEISYDPHDQRDAAMVRNASREMVAAM